MRKSLLLALSLLGEFISIYLWWVYTSASHPLVCLGTGCDVVRASRYAIQWGLPLPVFGAAMYGALVLLIFAEDLLTSELGRIVRYAFTAISGAGFAFSLYLTSLEAFVIHAWCAWCVGSAIVITLIFALAILEIIHPTQRPDEAGLSALRAHASLLLTAVILGGPAFYFLSRHGEVPSVVQASAEVMRERLIRPDSHVTGNPDASVTVVEFADFECPACGREAPTVQEVIRKYGDKVRFIFRHFPLEQIHSHALYAAEASECAAAQGKFWEAEQKLYENQSDLTEPAIAVYATELGLDKARFTQCLSNHSMLARVRQDMADGVALGVDRTPTFFVDQQKFGRAISVAEFSQLLDHELAAKSGTTGSTMTSSASAGLSSDASSSTGLLPGSGTSIFSNPQDSAMACSNDEAKQEQPDLIRTPDARQLFGGSSKPLFVDVRSAKDFSGGHIPAAMNIPVDDFERRWNILPRDRTIVLYESGRSPGDICGSSRAAGRVLLAHGFPRQQVKVYQDGLEAWQKAGLPVTP